MLPKVALGTVSNPLSHLQKSASAEGQVLLSLDSTQPLPWQTQAQSLLVQPWTLPRAINLRNSIFLADSSHGPRLGLIMQIVQGSPADAHQCALMWSSSSLLPGLQTETSYPCTSLRLSSSQSAYPLLPVRVFSAESGYGIPFRAEPCTCRAMPLCVTFKLVPCVCLLPSFSCLSSWSFISVSRTAAQLS